MSFAEAASSLSADTANAQGHMSVQAPGKAKKEDKDKVKLTDLIDKSKATREERDADVSDVVALAGATLAQDDRGIYEELTLRHEDIGADNDQIFLIEGDSLLLEILSDPLLDWKQGGQMLHVLYALEQYIRRFQEGGRVFRFVFFHCFGGVAWADSPFVQLIRETVLRHLRTQLHIAANEFQDWWSPEAGFHEFLERVDPAFILVGDGSGAGRAEVIAAAASAAANAAANSLATSISLPSASASSSSAPAAAAVSGVDSVDALSTFLSQLSVSRSAPTALPPFEIVRSLTLYLLSHHFRVIRLTELSFANNSMYAFQMAMALAYKKKLRAEGGYKPHAKMLAQAIPLAAASASAVAAKDAQIDAVKGAPLYRVTAGQSFDAKLYAKLSAQELLKSDARLLQTTYALAKLVSLPASAKAAASAGVSVADLAKAVLCHSMLLRHLPLDSRCLVWERAEAQGAAADSTKLSPLLNEFFEQLLSVIVGAGAAASTPADAAASLDLFDGRLLAFLLHTVRSSSSLGWSAPMEKQLLAAYAALRSECATLPASFVPFQSVKAISDAAVQEQDEAKLAAEAQAKYAATVAAPSNVPGGASNKAGASSSAAAATPASAAAPGGPKAAAAAADDDLGSWDDGEEDSAPAPAPVAKKAAAPAPAPKAAEEEDVGSWEDLDDEEEEKKDSKPAAAAPAAAASSSSAASAPAAVPVSKEAAALLPISALENKFVSDVCGSLDSLLASNGLLTPAHTNELSASAKAYAVRPGVEIDDGMDSEDKPKAPQTRREQRAASRQVNYWEQYSKSLVGGRLVLREVVVAATVAEEGSDDDDEKKDGGKGHKAAGGKAKADKKAGGGGKPGAGGGKKGGGGGKGAKAGELSMKDKIKAQVEENQRLKEVQKITGKINVASGLKSLDARIAKLDSEMEQVGDASAIPALLLLLDWCMEAWKIAKPKGDMQPAVKVFVLIHDIYRRFKQYLQADDFKRVSTALIMIGFEEAAARLSKQFVSESEGRVDAAAVKVDLRSSAFPPTLIGLSYNRFQLEYCGPYMLRNVDSAPDDRVTKFYPDKWQRDLLDVADAGQSALIVAPTSAGKTFISYYVMKNVLAFNKTAERSRDKGIVVYVSPNKALVNRLIKRAHFSYATLKVSADVYQRYGPVFGTATEDHQDKALTSEVLITVPSILEKLLLAPNREEWVHKIRWVIFDEVHLISTAGEGSIWERCLSLIRCPFLALSATVGNPRGFHSWLSRLDALRGRKVHLIVHETRWSDLEKGMYLPADPSVAPHNPELLGGKFDMRTHQILPSQCASVRVHPCAAVGAQDFADSKAFPKEVSFSPRDSLSLYDALMKHANAPSLTAALKSELAALSPDAYFPDLLINKARAMEYEARLKLTLTSWLEAGLTAEVASVMSALTGDLRDRIGKMEGLSGLADSCYDVEFIRKHFFSLLLELNARDQLPGIVFSNDPELCVQLVQDTLEKLEELESKVLESESVSEDSKLKIRAKAQTLKALKKNRDKIMKNKQAEEESRDADQVDLEIEAESDAYVVDPRFSFIDETEKMDSKELNYWIQRTLYKTQWKRSHPLIRALFRGIGVHHGGLVKQYRDLVETLFRGKHLKVVVATATLALGVNMPARSVTLCGDSKLLTPLQYRQMSGRAGRRGYDNIGHVVFFAVPPRKIFRLLKSPLNSLRGHFPITTTLALKMMDYYTLAVDKKDAAAALMPLLREPFFADTYTGSHLLSQIQFYFRYSLDLLHDKSLIDRQGKAYGLSTLATQMHAADPSNYGFVALLESGHIANICKSYEQDKNGVARELLALLAHLFYRVPAPAHVTRANFLSGRESANQLLLPPLPAVVRGIIGQHNAQTMRRFTNFVRTFSKLDLHKVPVTAASDAAASQAAAASSKAALPVEGTPPAKVYEGFYQTPVSGLSFPWVWSKSCVPAGSVMEALFASARKFDARSPFVALSGHADDDFTSARGLADSVRNGLFLDSKLIPVCTEDLDSRGNELQLNAYVVDFYRNAHFYSLIQDNRLSDAQAWGLLKQWSLLLSAITTVLKTLSVDEANDAVVKSFDHLSTTFDHSFNAIINV